MPPDNETQRSAAKLGPRVKSGTFTVDNTARSLADEGISGPLPDGHYTFEPSVDTWALQCVAGVTPDATMLANEGVFCPADRETEFNVDATDGFLFWTRVGSTNGTARPHRRDKAKGAT